jgi:hypothetical protein
LKPETFKRFLDFQISVVQLFYIQRTIWRENIDPDPKVPNSKYGFRSRKLSAKNDPDFESFALKNIILAENVPHKKSNPDLESLTKSPFTSKVPN